MACPVRVKNADTLVRAHNPDDVCKALQRKAG